VTTAHSALDAHPGPPASAATPRVSLYLPSLAGGGAERAILGAAAGLRSRGHDATLVLGTTDGPLAAELPVDVPTVVLGRDRARRSIPALVRHLRHDRPAALIAGLAHASAAADLAIRLARSGTVLVPRLANTHSAQLAAATSGRERRMLVAAARCYRRAPLVIAPASGVADDLVASVGVDPGRVRVVPNPVVDDRVLRATERPARHRFFAPGSPPVVLAVGRLVPHKDMGGLLEAFAVVRGRVPATLLLLGEGPERPALLARARALGLGDVVDAPGFDPDPFPAMARAGVYVLASRYEGSPGSLIQALACGAPLVATDCPTGPRDVLDGGRWGRLVPVGDGAAMADAIVGQLARGRTPRPVAAWRAWSVEASADAYEALVHDAAALGRARR
jgi:glycosyltransferase involved in cell wall biosynthesis